MAKVNREELIRSLESVQPGLSSREIVEQSNCFIFQGGQVMAFNDEVLCRHPSLLPEEFSGAVRAEKLLEVLRRMPEDEVSVEPADSELRISGKGRKTGIIMDAEVLLPIDSVEQPDKWTPLHSDFCEAIGIVGQCAGRDESRFVSVCVHIHPKWVEAFDDIQLCRWKLPTGFAGDALVRQSSVSQLVSSGVTEFAETDSWVHFRSPGGLTISCRRYVEDYPDLTKVIKVEGGIEAQLPKGLIEAADTAQLFSSENDENQVLVELRSGKLRVKGQGVSGWYSEIKKLTYTGPPLTFLIAPDLLTDIVKRHARCLISQDRLRVNGGSYVYVTALSAPEGETSEEDDEESRQRGKKAMKNARRRKEEQEDE